MVCLEICVRVPQSLMYRAQLIKFHMDCIYYEFFFFFLITFIVLGAVLSPSRPG